MSCYSSKITDVPVKILLRREVKLALTNRLTENSGQHLSGCIKKTPLTCSEGGEADKHAGLNAGHILRL